MFNILFSSSVDMKDKNSTSTLRRILVNCSVQAKEYGGCVAAKVPEVEHDMCLKQFLALKNCMQNMVSYSRTLKQKIMLPYIARKHNP
ncbi:hypothetical protein Ddye_014806 [Dipteronia dyeriana]|uniref:Uncharacterized protein n=1 Tax=Dipteronia dyeriana TaxID=168575 RepID=A0AAD9U3T2_9ROSI|nr:hypothetical protein Ddye_014806 [Dipteronia dyeriana]